jgi:hypothetical protein
MTGNLELVLVYSAPHQRALPLARVKNEEMLLEAARAALADAETKAAAMARVDCALGAIETQEVARLRRVLEMFLPEIAKGENQ